MGTTATVRQRAALQRRRIIERPRLLALLDESAARVRTLVAPAGYGKTTLAEQWVGREGRRGAWFTARRSSTDVAALALGIARASTDLVDGCEARLREHLRALPAPAENVEVLAEILGEDLEEWPSDGWLVVDEYEEIATAEAAERFVAALVAASPVQLLIASRQRPSWVTARRILYGEVLELNQTALAMDSTEAAEVLAGRDPPSASGLVALANGWPAVIGLASVSTAVIEDGEQVPESLYRFFAEEVFGALGEDVQAGLATLAIAPVLDRPLAVELLGAQRAEAVTAAALDVGILVERGSRLELHPLARSFLEERSEQLGLAADSGSVAACIDHYRARRDWDAAFDLIARHGSVEQLESLLLETLDELLETARLSTIVSWCALAHKWGKGPPVFALARAEVALRQGHLAEAQAHAEAATLEGSDVLFRTLFTAGRAAHLASREEEALALYGRAEAAASTESMHRDALWGQLMCLIDLERPEAASALEVLRGEVRTSDPRDVVRAAGCTLNYQLRLGRLDLAEADRAVELLQTFFDPLGESAFRSVYSYVLALNSRYDEALAVATGLLATARRYRLDFAAVYGLCAAAIAHAGRRRWDQASRQMHNALQAARAQRDTNAEQFSYGVSVRTLAQQGKFKAAFALDIPELGTALPASRAEVLGSLALALAAAGKAKEALFHVDQIDGTTHAAEPTVLVSATEAIVGVKRRERNAIERVVELEETAFKTGALDILVTAYRSTPELLAVLLRASPKQERIFSLLRKARDEDLAGTVGHSIASTDDPTARLSRREREVFELLRQGLTNRQIAELLFISESTVKAHVHHIYDKLGVRSRTALTVQAMLERSDQATSAIEGADVVDDS